MMCEMNGLEKDGREVGRQPSDASGAPPRGTEAELSVTLNITHCLVYFPSPQNEELVHVQMNGQSSGLGPV